MQQMVGADGRYGLYSRKRVGSKLIQIGFLAGPGREWGRFSSRALFHHPHSKASPQLQETGDCVLLRPALPVPQSCFGPYHCALLHLRCVCTPLPAILHYVSCRDAPVCLSNACFGDPKEKEPRHFGPEAVDMIPTCCHMHNTTRTSNRLLAYP